MASNGWYFHHRMKWTVIVKSAFWFSNNKEDINEWLASEGIMGYNPNTTRIYLHSEEQATYFKLRWG